MKYFWITLGVLVACSLAFSLHLSQRRVTVPSPFAAYASCSEAEALAVGKEIAEGLNRGDPEPFNRYMPLDDFINEVVHDIPMRATDRTAFLRGARTSLGTGLGGRLLQNAGAGASFTLLRIQSRPDGRHALIRLHSGEGINYFDLPLATDPAGKVRVCDITDMLSGQPMSQNLRNLVVPMLAMEQKTSVDRLLGGGEGGDDAESIKRMGEIQGLLQRQDFAGAMAILRSLPPSLANTRALMAMRVQVAGKLGDAEYQEAMATMDAAYPNDPSLALMRIDRHMLAGEHDKALADATLVDEAVGGDPRLRMIMATCAAQAGKADLSRAHAKTALEGEPDSQDLWFQALGTSVIAKDHAETARLMTAMEERFDDVAFAPEGVDEFREFCASPEYAAWKAGH